MQTRLIPVLVLLAATCSGPTFSMAQSASSRATEVQVSAKAFDSSADAALRAMKTKAEELKIGGVAVLAYFDGGEIKSWSSKMLVVGRMKDEQTATEKGSNLLGIAYAKAAEMADTLKDSGSKIRPPMTGEFGWDGGVIVRVKTGYIIAAFSGGKGEDDVAVSRTGLTKVLEEVGKAK